MRPMWSGSLSFGLINIPVRLYSATEDHALSFDMLHKKDLSPIRFARICKEDEKEVPYKDIVKGYEYSKGEYVVVSEEDFKNADAHRANAIEILAFAKEEEIDTIFFEKPYFLEPAKGGDKAYALLREALEVSGKVGVVKFVFRNREHIGVVKPYQNAIVLNQMRFVSEVRSIDGLKLPEAESSKKEVEVAVKLIGQLTEKFNPKAYKDTYVEQLKKVIDQKIKGTTPSKKGKTAAVKSPKVHDIMSLLKASLEEEKPRRKKETGAKVKKVSKN
ncbi:MAG: Ku protein [Parachlamydiaceae bacterium]|nr:Ku protein [Parachlamydiaceae bacterium]